MIENKKDLYEYMEADRVAFGKAKENSLKKFVVDILYPDYNYNFVRCLRKLEYCINTHKLRRYYYHWKHERLQIKSGIELNANCCEKGIFISHGKIVVSSAAKIGEGCKILSDVTIGGQGRYDIPGVPIIGKRVFIGTGAKIIGNVEIADDCVIGANAVVVHSITESGVTIAGNPAKIVSRNNSYHYVNRK